jgi:hypothetical protein
MLTFKLLILSFDIRLVIDETYYVHLDQEADNSTLYGVCLHVPEIVQRPPGILGGTSSPISLPSGLCSRFLVSAPRCYCLLTKVPFFELHFEMLNRLVPFTAWRKCLLCSCFPLIQ